MKFLIGLAAGLVAAALTLSIPEPRDRLMELLGGMTAALPATRAYPDPATATSVKPLSAPPTLTTREAPTRRERDRDHEGEREGERERETSLPDPAPGPAPGPGDLAASATDNIAEPTAFSGPSLFQVAWSPFRSATSAAGFADELARKVPHDFEVVRVGPGRYEVGFEFTTEPERREVLAAVQALAGFAPDTPPRVRAP